MARAAKASTTTAVANWDEELARQAEVAKKLEANVGSGNFFSFKAGQMSLNGEVFPNNEAAIIVLDAVLEHVYFADAYDPDNPAPPTCYGFGREEDKEIVPADNVIEAGQAQADVCGNCEFGKFGSAERGKGRACRWIRRLAIISAGGMIKGTFHPEEDAEVLAKSQVAYAKLPPTSVALYSGVVKQVANVLKRPPHGVYMRMWAVPDAKTQFKVNFEALGPVPNALMAAVMKRHKEQTMPGVTDFPYNLEKEEAAAPAPKKAAPKAKRKY